MKFRTYGLGVAVFLVSAQAAIAGELNPVVLVTTPPLKPYVDTLLHGIGESRSLLRPGQDAHTFTLSPSQRHALAEADVIILPDRQMSPTLDKLLATEEKRGAKIVELTSFVEAKALPYPKTNPWLEAAGEQEEHGEHADEETALHDPHLWLDPLRMAALTLPVAEAIAVAAPSHRAQLRENAKDAAFHLREEVQPGVAAVLANAHAHTSISARPQIPFITYHAAYQYFLKRFNLEPQGEVTQRPENYLGARTLHDVVEGAGKLSIHCVISETDSPLVRRIAEASGAKIVMLSPESLYTNEEVPVMDWVGNDYDRLLLKTALSFAGCL